MSEPDDTGPSSQSRPLRSSRAAEARPGLGQTGRLDEETPALEQELELVQTSKKAITEAQNTLSSCKQSFSAEVQKMMAAFSVAEARINSTLDSIEAYEDRLSVVESRLDAYDELNLTEVLGEDGTLTARVKVLEEDMGAMKTEHLNLEKEFRAYRDRPMRFEYTRTVVCNNIKMEVPESHETRMQLATRVLQQGMRLDPVPKIVDVARLPYNPATREATYHPGLKIELESNEDRQKVLRHAKNLKGSPYEMVNVRESMSPGQRRSIDTFRHLTNTMRSQGMHNIPQILPSGMMREWRPPRFGAPPHSISRQVPNQVNQVNQVILLHQVSGHHLDPDLLWTYWLSPLNRT